ncbi:MAG: hypothetical protein ACE364_00555 [Chlorobiota bacterium]
MLKRFNTRYYKSNERNSENWFTPKVKDFNPSNKDVKRINKELEEIRTSINNHKQSIENQNNQLVEIDSTIKDAISKHTNGTLNNKEFEETIKQCKSNKSKILNSVDVHITEEIIESLKAKESELTEQLNKYKENAKSELIDKKVKELEKQYSKLQEVALNFESELQSVSQIATDIKRIDENFNKNGLHYSRIYNGIDEIAVNTNEVLSSVDNLIGLGK